MTDPRRAPPQERPAHLRDPSFRPLTGNRFAAGLGAPVSLGAPSFQNPSKLPGHAPVGTSYGFAKKPTAIAVRRGTQLLVGGRFALVDFCGGDLPQTFGAWADKHLAGDPNAWNNFQGDVGPDVLAALAAGVYNVKLWEAQQMPNGRWRIVWIWKGPPGSIYTGWPMPGDTNNCEPTGLGQSFVLKPGFDLTPHVIATASAGQHHVPSAVMGAEDDAPGTVGAYEPRRACLPIGYVWDEQKGKCVPPLHPSATSRVAGAEDDAPAALAAGAEDACVASGGSWNSASGTCSWPQKQTAGVPAGSSGPKPASSFQPVAFTHGPPTNIAAKMPLLVGTILNGAVSYVVVHPGQPLPAGAWSWSPLQGTPNAFTVSLNYGLVILTADGRFYSEGAAAVVASPAGPLTTRLKWEHVLDVRTQQSISQHGGSPEPIAHPRPRPAAVQGAPGVDAPAALHHPRVATASLIGSSLMPLRRGPRGML